MNDTNMDGSANIIMDFSSVLCSLLRLSLRSEDERVEVLHDATEGAMDLMDIFPRWKPFEPWMLWVYMSIEYRTKKYNHNFLMFNLFNPTWLPGSQGTNWCTTCWCFWLKVLPVSTRKVDKDDKGWSPQPRPSDDTLMHTIIIIVAGCLVRLPVVFLCALQRATV